jgi:hypothetical protein
MPSAFILAHPIGSKLPVTRQLATGWCWRAVNNSRTPAVRVVVERLAEHKRLLPIRKNDLTYSLP